MNSISTLSATTTKKCNRVVLSGFFITPLSIPFSANVTTVSFLSDPQRNGLYKISCSSVINNSPRFASFLAFNGSVSGGLDNSWVPSSGQISTISISVPFSFLASKYVLLPWSSGYEPIEWCIYGSNDNIQWTLLDQRIVPTNYWTSFIPKTFLLSINVPYSCFMLKLIKSNGTYMGLGQFNIG